MDNPERNITLKLYLCVQCINKCCKQPFLGTSREIAFFLVASNPFSVFS